MELLEVTILISVPVGAFPFTNLSVVELLHVSQTEKHMVADRMNATQ